MLEEGWRQQIPMGCENESFENAKENMASNGSLLPMSSLDFVFILDQIGSTLRYRINRRLAIPAGR